MDSLLQDIRFALRGLKASPGFSLPALLTLALGIGATAAVFGVLDVTVLRPLPGAAHAERLVQVVIDRPGATAAARDTNVNLSYQAFTDLAELPAFAGVVAHTPTHIALGTAAGTRRVEASGVSAGFFGTVGVALALGREFLPDEDRVGAARDVALLSHAFWRQAFGGDPAILNRTVSLNGRPYAVVGVVGPAFPGLARGVPTDVYVPLTSVTSAGPNAFTRRTLSWLDVFARLAPAVTPEQATNALASLDANLVADGVWSASEHRILRDGSRGLEWPVLQLKRPLSILLAAVVLVLAIACANVGGLLLARGAARRRELAIRLSLGSGRGRLVRQLVTESLVLAVAGGAMGLLLARWLMDAIPALPSVLGTPLVLQQGIESRTLLFAVAATTFAAVLFGVLPALRAARADLVAGLKEGTADVPGGRLGPRDLLVVGQIALTLVMLAGSGLLLRTTRNLAQVDLGFTTRQALLVSVDLEPRGWRGRDIAAFWDRLLERAAALPGVEAVTTAQTMVPSPGGSRWDGVSLEGHAPNDLAGFEANSVGPGYFAAMGIALVHGREFGPADVAGALPVAVINEAMARRYWPGQNALGRHLLFSSSPVAIVGIARDGKQRSLRGEAQPGVYFPLAQQPVSSGWLILRTAGDPLALATSVRALIRAVDPDVPVSDVRSLAEHTALASARERLVASVATLFAALALVLAAVGLGGLLVVMVAQRTHEFGIRLALGAKARDVLALVLRQAGVRVLVGLAAGLAGVLAVTRLLSSLLYGVEPLDPVNLGAAVLVLVVVSLLAAWLPARRAARVDPLVALRSE